MRISYLFLSILISLPFVSACSDHQNEEQPRHPALSQTNFNANPTEGDKTFGRLELPHLAGGNTTVIVHRAAGYDVNFITEWDNARRAQRWSAYILDKKTLEVNTDRYTENGRLVYFMDPAIPANAYFDSDPYWNSGFDHGHICASADRRFSIEGNKQTMYLTNMQPQYNSFNAGVWANMEKAVRNAAARDKYTWTDSLFVCKGGTIDEGSWGGYNKVYQQLSSGLLVPRYFFMALLRKKGNSYNGIALWISQVGDATTMQDTRLAKYAISIDELEKRTGIDFFCNLPDETEEKVESECVPSFWALN